MFRYYVIFLKKTLSFYVLILDFVKSIVYDIHIRLKQPNNWKNKNKLFEHKLN